MVEIEIRNEGPAIHWTNYWTSAHAAAGKVYLSANAGAFRLLVPRPVESFVPDMAAATLCIVSRGPWPERGLADALEVLFDDGTPDPFALHLHPASLDRMPLDADAAREWDLTVWTEPRPGSPPGPRLARPCRYRRSARLPDLRPWPGPG